VIEQSSSRKLVEQRICRLLLESSRFVGNRSKELKALRRHYDPDDHKHDVLYEQNWHNLNRYMISQLVHEQLETVYSTRIPRSEFGAQYTLVCKLDYGLRFFAKLVDYYEGPQAPDPNRKHWTDERVDTKRLIYVVLAILRRISSTYLAMERSDSGSGNLIGVEMKDLTPGNAPEKVARIGELLLKDHYPGLSWMMSDCPAWFF
jgi:hypothetical protein